MDENKVSCNSLNVSFSSSFVFQNLVLDARVLVDIAQFIEERTRTLAITWSWSDFKGYRWTNKALKKRTLNNHT